MPPKPKAAKSPGKKFKPKAVQQKEIKIENGGVEDVKLENKSLMNNDAFKQLISTSQKEASWTRYKEKKKQKLKYRVAFGELEMGGAVEGERTELTFIDQEDDCKQQKYELSKDQIVKQAQKTQKRLPSLLDYQQQYPTMLPLKEPAEESQVRDIEDGLASFLPPEHATEKDKDGSGGKVVGDGGDEDELLLFQMPTCLPLSFQSPQDTPTPTPLAIHQITPQKIGKLLTYQNGEMKLQIGDFLFDVTKGCDMRCSYGAAIVNAPSKNFIHAGEVGGRLVCSPNVNNLLGLSSHKNLANTSNKGKQQENGDLTMLTENGVG
eukprot:TRINITY_DN2919_c0_g1_i3.p1 TRINITY_DN2919_c0_g1~~TRINITY_DN2919_c0_g1_i3.p1  ORF type:complete len:321 (+),score=65.50 TRINITY_DN2919_c0_g1_i3:158-1120(+)